MAVELKKQQFTEVSVPNSTVSCHMYGSVPHRTVSGHIQVSVPNRTVSGHIYVSTTQD